MLVSSHDSISIQDTINACKKKAYLSATAAFLILLLQKVGDN